MITSEQHSTPQAVRIWDLPTRLFHWAFALAIVGVFISGMADQMAIHVRLGAVVASLWLWRIVWGFMGGHWSRFASFVPTPARIGKPTAGHSVSGAVSVCAILLVVGLQVFAGLGSDDDISFTGPLAPYLSPDMVSNLTHYHRSVGKVLVLALAVLHVLAIFFYTFWRKKRLVPAMLHGHKTAADLVGIESWPTASEDTAQTRLLALGVLALCLGLVFGVVF